MPLFGYLLSPGGPDWLDVVLAILGLLVVYALAAAFAPALGLALDEHEAADTTCCVCGVLVQRRQLRVPLE
jgi:hypothetical protein